MKTKKEGYIEREVGMSFNDAFADEGMPMAQKCETCIYYLYHFVKYKNEYRKVNCGHCINTNVKSTLRKTNKICKYYEEKILNAEKEMQMETATKEIARIRKILSELNEVLKT